MTNIHPTAIIDNSAKIDKQAFIGPYCIIGKNVTLAKGVKLLSHVAIGENTFIDENTTVYPFATIGFIPQDLKFNNETTYVKIGKNCSIREHVSIHLATINNKSLTTIIGNNCLIMSGSHVAHDCELGDNVIIASNAALGGHVVLENNVIIGGGVGVQQFHKIGKYTIIAGVCAITYDIAPYLVASGSRKSCVISGVNMIGLKRANFPLEQIVTIRNAYKILFAESDKHLKEKINLVKQAFANNHIVDEIVKFIELDRSKTLLTRYKESNENC